MTFRQLFHRFGATLTLVVVLALMFFAMPGGGGGDGGGEVSETQRDERTTQEPHRRTVPAAAGVPRRNPRGGAAVHLCADQRPRRTGDAMTEQAQQSRADLERDVRAWRGGRVAAFVALALSATTVILSATPSPLLVLAWLLATPPVMLGSMVLVEQALRRLDELR